MARGREREGGLVTSCQKLKRAIAERADQLGFDLVRITVPEDFPQPGPRLESWLAEGHHGTMDWMAANAERRRDPRGLWAQVRSIVMLGASYAPPYDPMDALGSKAQGLVSAYAARRDYQDVLKGRLRQL